MRTPAAVLTGFLLGVSLVAHASDAETGKRVFLQDAQPPCGVCHALADAGSTGDIGPDLDELKPSREAVVNAVTGGVGVMPAFSESLSPEQIEAVAIYVSQVTGGDK